MDKRTRLSLIGITILGLIVVLCYLEIHYSGKVDVQSAATAQDDATLARFKEECAITVGAQDVTTLSKCLGISSEGLVWQLNYRNNGLGVTTPGYGYAVSLEQLSDFVVIFPDDPRRSYLLDKFLTQERIKP